MEFEKICKILFSGDELLTVSLLLGQKIPFHKLAKYITDKLQNINQFEIIKDYTTHTHRIRRSTWHKFEHFIIKELTHEFRCELKCENFIGIQYPNWGFVSIGLIDFKPYENLEKQYDMLFKTFRKNAYNFILNRLVHVFLKSLNY